MNIYGQTLTQLENYFTTLGENPAKGKLLFRSLYQEKITDFAQISSFKATLRCQLAKDFSLTLPKLVTQLTDHNACKFLFALEDSNLIEAVLMQQKFGFSLCLSTQVGCNMACAFCQSGRFKKVRNLSAAEMTAQLLAVEQLTQNKIANVVLMGIGEPFDNYEQVMAFIHIISQAQGLSIGLRHITVSTCGIVPAIIQYGHEPIHGQLAISLHSANDQLRSQLMPANRRYPLSELMLAVDDYLAHTRKKVMLEYILLKDLNDSSACAEELARLIGNRRRCQVNLIRYNETQNSGFYASDWDRCLNFYQILKQHHLTVTIRREFGATLNAACGQLRADYETI